MKRRWCVLVLPITLNFPALAASVHRTTKAPSALAQNGAISALDHVPFAAERILASYGVVTSTFRTVAHNREVGGVADSYHLRGQAIDVARRPGINHARIAAALRTAGYVLVESLDEGNHSHFAFTAPVHADVPRTPEQRAEVIGSYIAADEHGSLLWDLNPRRAKRSASEPILRIHIRKTH